MLRFITHLKGLHNVTRRYLIAFAVISLMIFGTISPIWATVDFDAYLPIAANPIDPNWKFTKSIFLDYSNGGKLKDAFSGKDLNVSFTDDSDNNPDIKNLMQQINSNIASERKSPATMTKLTINYQVQIHGGDNKASIDYRIIFSPVLTGYVLNKGDANTPTTFDVSWMGWRTTGPITITTQQYGPIEINYPLDVLKSQLPDAYNVLKGTDAEKSLQNPLIDASPLMAEPIDKWDTLFDPAYTLTETAGYGFKGQKVAVTTYSSGLSNLGAGSLKVSNIDMDFNADAKYHISTVDRASQGTFNVDGHANAFFVQGEPAISTTAKAVAGISNTTAGGMSTMTIYAMAAFAAVIAGGIFWWSNRKMKESIKRAAEPQQPRAPVEYEERKHWADQFDPDKKRSAL
jgi:hypothetical protein